MQANGRQHQREPDGASVLRQLVEFSPRKDAALGRRYLAGHFGAVPTATDEEVDDAVLGAINQRHA